MKNNIHVRKHKIWLYAILIVVLLSSCASNEEVNSENIIVSPPTNPEISITETVMMPSPEPSRVPFEMSITGFAKGEIIPSEFACTGENNSPSISWTMPPEGSKSLALLFDDPDAPGGSWVHWILFNIPVDSSGLAAGIHAAATHGNGMQGGANSWEEMAYGGPCPPEGSTHEYLFILYALDSVLDLESGASKNELLSAIDGHVLDESRYTGFFGR